MPDLLSTLADQVRQYSGRETLTCALYELRQSHPETNVQLVMAVARNRHMPKGALDARMVCESFPSVAPVARPCRSPDALQQLLEEWHFLPGAHYLLVLRRVPAAGDEQWPWPPPMRPKVPDWHPHLGFQPDPEEYAGYPDAEEAEAQLRHDAAYVFSPSKGFIVKVLFRREWAGEQGHPLKNDVPINMRAWGRTKMAPACAKAIYTLVGEC